MDTIECVTKEFTSPSFLLNELFFFYSIMKKKIKWMKFGVMNFYTKEICTRRLVFSLRQNIRSKYPRFIHSWACHKSQTEWIHSNIERKTNLIKKGFGYLHCHTSIALLSNFIMYKLQDIAKLPAISCIHFSIKKLLSSRS